ncbi:uncharacterized protein hrob [Eucyclogobius newberryi]|uniref:uncharacterized protein hrob n=1 Tax=Eucyclogobius newberryi TaxID=166745 RepID=UPI003B5A075B
MACKLSSLFSIGEDFDDEDILGTDWGTRSSSSRPVEAAAAVSSSLLRASSITNLETERNRPQEIGVRSAAQFQGTSSRTISLTAAGQTAALSLRQPSASSPLNYARTISPAQQPAAEPPKPKAAPDDFDDWEFDLADLEEVDDQLGRLGKSTSPAPQVSTVTTSSSANALRPLGAPTPRGGGALREISQSVSGLNGSNPPMTNELRSVSSHSSDNGDRSVQKTALPSGISKLSRFAFDGVQTSPSPSSAGPSSAKSTPVQSRRPPSFAPHSPGVFPGLTAASPSCLRRGPGPTSSTPSSSERNRGLFECVSPAPRPRPITPSSLHTPTLTNRLVQLVSASSTKKRPRSESNRPRTRRFPGPAGLLPQQPQGQSLDDIVVCVSNTPAHGAVARSPSQCSSSQAEEEDFSGPAWTSMKSEMGLDERNPSCFLHTYSVVMVLRKAALKQLVRNKVPNMAVLLKNLLPTHTDAKAVFKDPTGEMQGTVHRRLLEDRAGELKAGAVLLLKQVGVFSPSHRNHYLNVTPNNLLRVYSPDGACMSSTQLPPLAMEPVLLSSTPHVLREPVSKMQLLFDEDEDKGQDQEGAAEGSPEQQETVDQRASTKHQQPTTAEQDSGWGADDLDELLGELPLYSV